MTYLRQSPLGPRTVALLLAASCVQGQNLVSNGGFELNAGTNGSSPLNWPADLNSYGSYNGSAHTGGWSLRAGDGNNTGGRYQDLATTASRIYTGSLWVGNDGGSPGSSHLRVLAGAPAGQVTIADQGTTTTSIFDSNGLVANQLFTVTGLWQQVVLQFTATTTNTYLGLYNADMNGDTFHSVNVDDVSVTATGSSSNLVLNGGFETNGGNGSDPANWTADFNSYGAYTGAAHAGSYGLHPGANANSGGRCQPLITVPGTTYNVKLWVENFSQATGTSHLRVLAGAPCANVTVADLGFATTTRFNQYTLVANQLSPTALDGSWTQVAFQFVAGGSTTRLGLYNASMSGDDLHSIDVDDVAVQAGTATVLAASANPSLLGSNVTFTATVQVTNGVAAAGATGAMVFQDNGLPLSTNAVSGGVAVWSTSALTVGLHVLSAVYSGDATYPASRSLPLVQIVRTLTQIPTTTTLLSSANPALVGSNVTFTASVQTNGATATDARGTMLFQDGSAVLGTNGVVSGTASLGTGTLAPGPHSITAQYGGDAYHAASYSAALAQTVATRLSSGRWTTSAAWAWYGAQPWLVGCNFLPSTAINDVEMWQAETYDPVTIDHELGLAQELGFNSIRVFLNYVVWEADAAGFKSRFDQFLGIADSHHLRVMPVLFDDCFEPEPKVGPQNAPIPGHNSQWVRSPGASRVGNTSGWPTLANYVMDMTSSFGQERRIVFWDLYNEPADSSLNLVLAAYGWARQSGPSQPLTSCVYGSSLLQQAILSQADIISIHNYSPLSSVQATVASLQSLVRPIVCTEWMAREYGSRFDTHLAWFKANKVGCWNWGLVAGRTQTYYWWGSPTGAPVPVLWQHDILHKDGSPFSAREKQLIQITTGVTPGPLPQPQVVLPNSASAPATWRYTTANPGSNWFALGFNDSGWSQGLAPFGQANTSVARHPNTAWNNADLWLRRDFFMPPGIYRQLALGIYHDASVEIYLNGVLTTQTIDSNNAYDPLDVGPAAAAALNPGHNILAVHCNSTDGGHYLDVGVQGLPQLSSGPGAVSLVDQAFALVNRFSGLRLSGAGADGGAVAEQVASGEANQAWMIAPASNVCFTLACQANGLCLGTGAATGNGAPLRVENLSYTNGQLWQLLPAGLDGTFMVNVFSGLAADVRTANAGETAAQRPTNGSVNQQWVLLAPPRLAANAGAGHNLLSWPAAVGALGYNLKRSPTSGGPYATIAAGIRDSSYTDYATTNGTTYYYVLSSITAWGESPNSVEANAMPSLSDGLVTWFKADSLSGVTNGELWLRELTNGALVYYWPDASGAGYDAGPLGAAPACLFSAINGQPALRFAASNGTCLVFNRSVQDDFTMLCVFRSNQGIGTATAFYSGAGLVSGDVAGVTDDFGTSLNANGQVLAGTGNPDVTCVSGGPLSNDGQPHILTFKRTRFTGALRLYVDGVLAASASGGTQSMTAPYLLSIGCQQTLNNYLDGDIAEVKIFNTPLSDTERVAEEDALKCKYGLGSGTAPMPPAGLAATAGNRSIALSWAASAGASGYHVSWSTNISGPFTARGGSVAGTGFVDTNAVSGVTNCYAVAALSSCGVGTNSAPVGVLLPRPGLAINLKVGSLAISWPAWAADWKLYSTTNLAPTAVWTPVTNSAQSSGDNFVAIITVADDGTVFYRLQSP